MPRAVRVAAGVEEARVATTAGAAMAGRVGAEATEAARAVGVTEAATMVEEARAGARVAVAGAAVAVARVAAAVFAGCPSG